MAINGLRPHPETRKGPRKSELDAGLLGNGVHVLVATSGQIHQQDLVLGERRGELGGISQGVG